MNRFIRFSLLALSCAFFWGLGAAETVQKPLTDLDALMKEALARRDAGRDAARDYVLDEVERGEALGPGRVPIYRLKREYQWYVRDDIHVRSPVRFDGVALGEAERRKHEDEWIEQERKRKAKKLSDPAAPADSTAPAEAAAPPPADPSKPGPATLSLPIPEPRFVSEAYFLDFEFKPGNFYLAGREKLDGRDVLQVEYYPAEGDSARAREAQKEEYGKRGARTLKNQADIDRQFDKTSLVTLWVDPAERQIMKLTFNNVWLDFLPATWMVRVSGMRASMVMGQPFKGVWLPSTMSVQATLTLANGDFAVNYTREFSGYKRADVTSRILSPGPDPK